MAHRYTTLLLDADETIFDFNRAEHDSLEKVLAARNLPHGEEILSQYHRINASLWRAFERGEVTKDRLRVQRFEELFYQFGFPAGIDPDEISSVYLEQLGESDYLLPGADAFLYALKNGGFDLALITNGVARTQLRRLNKSGLAPLFSHVFVSEAVGAQKPLPAFFDAVLAARPRSAGYAGSSRLCTNSRVFGDRRGTGRQLAVAHFRAFCLTSTRGFQYNSNKSRRVCIGQIARWRTNSNEKVLLPGLRL